MKKYGKIALLVALALILLVTACTRQASTKAPTGQATPTGEAPFPFTTPGQGGGIADFGTQTAVAKTPQVVIATNTPEPNEGVQPEATAEPGKGGGETGGEETGGGVAEQPASNPPAEQVNTPVVERPTSYTIKKGEHPYCIARRYNLDIATLLANNGLNNNSKVSVGTTLAIPQSGSWSASAYGSRSLKAHPASYTVGAGDSVYSIACQYGDVTPEAILAVNGLANASDVKSGMSLQIP